MAQRTYSLFRNLRRGFTPIVLAALAALCACTSVKEPTTPKPAPPQRPKLVFSAETFERLETSDAKSWLPAFEAFARSCRKTLQDPLWESVCEDARTTDASQAEAFFKTHFAPWKVTASQGEELASVGLMTGYYEPLLKGSRTREAPYLYPIYAAPDDLLIIDLGELYPDLKGRRLRGKLEGRRVVPYDKRGVIENREAQLAPWAIAWVDDPVDAFFLHVQGSGRIRLPDGSLMRVGYADQNGWRYHSIGNWLIEHEHLPAHELSMQRIRAWAKSNPGKVKQALAQNPSFIFFEERSGDPNLGPIGAAGVELTPGASVAVDPAFWRLGTPFIVEVSQKRPELTFRRPVVAQDTGGAIKGAIRFDYFWGFGDEAGAQAGRQKSRVEAWVLVPVGADPKDILPGGAHEMK